jgi:thiol:disulfide interchange protein
MFLAATAAAQVRSSLSVDPGSATKQPSARLTVVIDPDWHISSLTQPEGGPFRTTIEIPPDQSYRLAGKISAPPPHTEHSAEFDVEVQTYEGRIEFVLPLEKNPDAKGPRTTTLTVRITYQACSGETCRLPETERIAAHHREP